MVDDDHLDALRSDIGAARVHEIIARFLDEADQEVAELVASGQDNPADVVRIAHRLAGSAGLVGAAQLRAHLSGLETAVKTGSDHPSIQNTIDEAPDIWKQTRSALLKRLEGMKTPLS